MSRSNSGVTNSTIAALLLSSISIFSSIEEVPAVASGISYNDRVCDLTIGSGSSANPYIISTADMLWEVTDCTRNGAGPAYFELANNIDVSLAAAAPTNSPIGYSTSALAYSFSGILDGKGYQINSVSMTRSDGAGLFALISGATLKNLTLTGSFNSTTGIAGSIAVKSYDSATIEAITNSALVSGNSKVGGIVGEHLLSNLSETGRVGLLIRSTTNTGNVSGNSRVGGLVGYSADKLVISSSGNTGTVAGASDTGGILGGTGNLGSQTYYNALNSGTITGTTYVGGLVGWSNTLLTMENSHNSGAVTANNNVAGGLIARSFRFTIINSHNSGDIASNAASGGGRTGGLVGSSNQNSVSLEIRQSFNTGAVSGFEDVGGLVGQHSSDGRIVVNDSYNSGAISGTQRIGGIFGISRNVNQINRSYNSGEVTGSSSVDGFSGQNSATISSSYTLVASGLVSTSSISDLRSASTFVGWNFNTVWGFGSCAENRGLPILRYTQEVGTYFSDGCASQLLLSFTSNPGSTFSVTIPVLDVPAGSVVQPMTSNFSVIGSPIALTDNVVVTVSASEVTTDVIYLELSMSSAVYTLGTSPNPLSWTTSLRAIHSWGSLGPTTISNAIQGANIESVPTDLPSTVKSLAGFFSGQTSFNGDITGWDTSNITSVANLFYNARSFNQDISGWNVTSIQNFSGMFWGAEIFNQDIGAWTVSAATTMANMFDRAYAFNQDISGWDVSNVTNMSLMFWNANSFNQPIGSWTTSSVSNMQEMFLGAESFNQDISTWNVSNVTNMLGMFKEATIFDQNLSTWSVGNVTNMAGMFQGVWDAKTRFNNGGFPLINQWVVSNVTDMSYMFSENSGFNQNLDDWDTSNVTNMRNMFYSSAFDEQIGGWDTSKVTNMKNMFTSTNFNQDISSWDTSNVTDMNSMFDTAFFFNQPIGRWTVSKVTDMSGMFNNARSFNQPLGTWNVASVSSMSAMFYEAILFNQDLSNWSTSSVTDMHAMFRGAASFNSPLTNWDVRKVVRMDQMFLLASSFNQPLSSWQPSSVSNFASMFNGASSFNQDINNWDVSSATDMQAMFYNATSFNQDLDSWDTSNVEYMGSMFNAATSFNGDIDNWNVTRVYDASAMFQNATSFNRDIGDWDLRGANNLALMFEGATAFNQDISDWTVSAVTTFQGMFWGATSFNQDLSNWDVSSGLYFPNMFRNASSFDQALRWNLASATDMENFFSGSGLSCENYDTFLSSASSTLPFLGVAGYQLGGGFYTPAALSDRSAIAAKGWEISDSPCVTAPSLSGSNVSKKTGEAISFTPVNSGGAATFTISPSLPSGISFSTATGAITGQLSSAYSANHVITATNRSGTSSITIAIEVTLATSAQDSSRSATNPVTTTQRLPIFDLLNKLQVPAHTVSSLVITGTNLELIRSVAMKGIPLTMSSQSSRSIRVELPATIPGVYNLNFALTEGSLEVSAALEFIEAKPASSSKELLVSVNRFSSWLGAEARSRISAWVPPSKQVVCIAYNDRPGIAARKKAISRATQACRFVMPGVNSRIFVFGKAGSLASTVKLRSP